MTLCAINVTSQLALVATDEVGYFWNGNVEYGPDGSPCVQNKLLVMTHARYVALVRGASDLMVYLFGELYRMRDIDAAVEHLPQILRDAGRLLRLGCKARGSEFPGNGVHLVGFSPSRGHMINAVCESDEAFQEEASVVVNGTADPGCSYGAYDPWLAGKRPPSGAEELAAYALQQVAHARAERPWAPFGGKLVLVEIRPDSMTVTRPCDLGLPSPKPATAEAKAAFQLQDHAATDVFTFVDPTSPIVVGSSNAIISSATFTTAKVNQQVIATIMYDCSLGGASASGAVGQSGADSGFRMQGNLYDNADNQLQFGGGVGYSMVGRANYLIRSEFIIDSPGTYKIKLFNGGQNGVAVTRSYFNVRFTIEGIKK